MTNGKDHFLGTFIAFSSAQYIVGTLPLKVLMKKFLASCAILISAVSLSAQATPVLQNGNFADNNVAAGSFKYSSDFGWDVSAPGWTFAGLSGISANSGAWGANAPADGSAYAFLQSYSSVGVANGSIAQTFDSTGTNNFTFNFDLAQRSNCCGDIGAQVVGVFLDGVQLNTFHPSVSDGWAAYSVSVANVGAGSHTISFAGLTFSDDTAAFVANVRLASTPAAQVPEPAPLALFTLALFAAAAVRRKSNNQM